MEAAKLAEEQLVLMDDRLGDPMFRTRLDEANKHRVFNTLLMLATQYEFQLTEEIKAGEPSVV